MVFSIPVNHYRTCNKIILNEITASVLATGNKRISFKPVKRITTVLCSALLATVAATADASLCEGLITHTQSVSVPLVGKPPLGKYYREPAFKTRVARITNAGKGNVTKPMYSTVQAWNSDESLMILFHRHGKQQGHYLYNGYNYSVIRRLDILPSDIEDVFWSHSDPHSLFYSSKASGEYGHFYKYNVANGSRTLLEDFTPICRGTVAQPGGDVQMQSLDDDLFGFRCLDRGAKNKKHIAFTYRVSTDETSAMELGDGTQWHNWAAPMPTPAAPSTSWASKPA